MINVGDIAEFQTANGLAYVQLIDKHPRSGGEMIRVFNRLFVQRPGSAAMLENEETYVAFTFLSELVKSKLVKIVFHLRFDGEIPSVRKRGTIARDGRVLSWVICDREGNEEVVSQLKPEQERLPIGAIWGFPLFVKRLEQGWTPERAEIFRQQAARKLALERAHMKCSTNEPTCKFFLYFPDAQQAELACARVKERGFDAHIDKEQSPVLLLATKHSPLGPDSIEKDESFMQGLAQEFNGEYDGHEIKVR